MAGRSLVLILLVVTTPLALADDGIRIQGSASLATALRRSLTEAFNTRYADVAVDWRAAGTGAAFVSLFAGDAELGLSSRSVSEEERALAHRLGLDLKEIVVGLDGLAVIVHPDNDVPSLTLEQLGDLYAGRIVSWVGFRGIDETVTLLGAPVSSGTNQLLDALVLGDDAAALSRDIDHAASTQEVFDRVATERGAVGFVSMSHDRSRVRTVPISAGSGEPLEPTPATVAAGTYPLRHPLHLYTVSEPAGQLRLFLTFLFLHRGSQLVSDAGLVPVPSFGTWSRELARVETAPKSHPVSVTRLDFGFRGRRLNRAVQNELRNLTARLAPGNALWVSGHEGPDETVAGRDLSYERAETVAAYLESQNIAPSRMIVDGRRSREPIASNAAIDGRRQNRRVDVWVLSR